MFRYLLILTALVSAHSVLAFERVVLLAPAAGDLFIKLDAQDKVVGVTRSNDDFPAALKVGSHIKPNIELIKGLEPDLLVISSNRFFSEHMAVQIGAEVFKYDPSSLDDILREISKLGGLLDKTAEAQQLTDRLSALQAQMVPLEHVPSVVFEVTQSPFIVAGRKSIVNGIVQAAGGRLIAPSDRKVVKFNVESVLVQNPDYYLYQVGPMNKKPVPPLERPNYRFMDSEVLKVDQLKFSRANSQSFALALELNQRFRQNSGLKN